MHFHNNQPLRGEITAPGDKSISHRALMLASLCEGTTHLTGVLPSEDVFRTAGCLAALGVDIKVNGDGYAMVEGVGIGGFKAPQVPLDCGNSGTTARLLMGLLAGSGFPVHLRGDKSLSVRPMGRVIEPLRQMGMAFNSETSLDKATLPLTVHGTSLLHPITYELPVPSAQVKTAVLLAALNCEHATVVTERVRSRDHTERMCFDFGIEPTYMNHGETRSLLLRRPALPLRTHGVFRVPGDPSSAAFPLVAALITPGSDVTVRNICLNPYRNGLFRVLRAMGAHLDFSVPDYHHGEFVGSIRARFSPDMTGVVVAASEIASMIDEFPVFFLAAAQAHGVTIVKGLSELRVKECDRLAVMVHNLGLMGVPVEVEGDDITIIGFGSQRFSGAFTAKVEDDHRIAMTMAVAAQFSTDPIEVDVTPIATSYPGFIPMLEGLHA